jgi:hypothetical protein
LCREANLGRQHGTQDRFILTSSHPGESIADAIEFARLLTDEYAGEDVQVVELSAQSTVDILSTKVDCTAESIVCSDIKDL